MRVIHTDGRAEYDFIEELKERNHSMDWNIRRSVATITADVRENGDAALDRYTMTLDGVLPENIEVPREAMDEALANLDPSLLEALEKAAANIRAYHSKQVPTPYEERMENGIVLGRKCRALHSVGIYVPGGMAAYPSTVLMNAIPAKIAGVGQIIMATPPQKEGWADPVVLAAAALAGVDRVFLVGGAQAIAAMAYGTATIPKVDKIVGPGNIFVETAKKRLYGEVDIDMVAGPSEILVLADETAKPAYVAADLLSQAEHDMLASAILVTHSRALADQVLMEIKRQSAALDRKDIIEEALDTYGVVLITAGPEESVELANLLAPEHLEIMMADPMSYVDRLVNAGSLFVGPYAPVPLGDYFAGPNHVLPTGLSARFFSPLSVEDFYKYYSYTYYPKEELMDAASYIRAIAEQEGLTAHARAIAIRQEEEPA